MKKLSFSLLLAAAVCFAACGNNQNKKVEAADVEVEACCEDAEACDAECCGECESAEECGGSVEE